MTLHAVPDHKLEGTDDLVLVRKVHASSPLQRGRYGCNRSLLPKHTLKVHGTDRNQQNDDFRDTCRVWTISRPVAFPEDTLLWLQSRGHRP